MVFERWCVVKTHVRSMKQFLFGSGLEWKWSRDRRIAIKIFFMRHILFSGEILVAIFSCVNSKGFYFNWFRSVFIFILSFWLFIYTFLCLINCRDFIYCFCVISVNFSNIWITYKTLSNDENLWLLRSRSIWENFKWET